METPRLLYLSRTDVEATNVSMPEIINALERMFKEKGEGKVEMPPKPGIHTRPDAFIHAMPAYIPSLNAAGMKWVSGYPDNWKQDLPYISGLIILNDPENGLPVAVMDATWITAMRTGAATAVAAKQLAGKDSSSVGILACGVQGRSNLEALNCIFDIEEVRAYDIKKKAALKYASDISERFNLNVDVVDTPKEAVLEMDIVVTSGPILKDPDPTIGKGWLKEGGFGSLVDFDSYWTGEALQEADKIYTDDVTQMDYYRTVGYFKKTPKPAGDLGELLAGKIAGRETPEERILIINLGLALDDMATAPLVYEKAKQKGIGTALSR